MASGPQENITLAIGLLNKLTLLRIEETQLNESIPSEIGLLADLVSIGLKYIHLGVIPPLPFAQIYGCGLDDPSGCTKPDCVTTLSVFCLLPAGSVS
jgi:hypothetical protein